MIGSRRIEDYTMVKGGTPTLRKFSELPVKTLGFTPTTFRQLEIWLDDHRDAAIVLDVKKDHLTAYLLMASSRHRGRLIPQAYDTQEIFSIREMGYGKIILTLYRCPRSRREILNFLRDEKVFAVTIPKKRVGRFSFARNLSDGGIFTYAHTVNSEEEAETLRSLGVCGIYTDFPTLFPKDYRFSDEERIFQQHP